MSGSTVSMLGKGCILVVFLGGLGVIVLLAVGMMAQRDGAESGDGSSGSAEAPAAEEPEAEAPEADPAADAEAPAGPALDRVRARGVLRVVMDTGEPPGAGTPPMYFEDAQGGRDGFDYAVARAIAAELGVPDVEIVHARYSALEQRLLQAEDPVDLLISGYAPTGAPGIVWSEPYLEFGLCLVVPNDSAVQTTADLVGRRVGIFNDEAAAAAVQSLVKGYTDLVRMEDGYWDALLAGRFDGFLYDYPYAAAELRALGDARPDLRGRLRIAQYNLTDSVYAVGVRSSEPELRAAVDGAIAAWRDSDAYPAAVKRYLKGGAAVVAAPAAGGRSTTVKPGDTLSGIAARELGDKGAWRRVWELNRARFPNPHLIEPGDVVLLP